MPLFEVFIPTTDPDGFNITARLRAASWIQALRNGLSKLGDTAEAHNILCDITETGMDVTEPKSGRVFRIREIPEHESQAAPPPRQPAPPAAQPATAPPPPAATGTAPPPAIAGAPPPATARRGPPPAAVATPVRAPARVPTAVASPAPAQPVVRRAPESAAPAATVVENPAAAAASSGARRPATAASPVPAAATPGARPQQSAPAESPRPPAAGARPLRFSTGADVEEERVTREKASGVAARIGRAREQESSIEELLFELFHAAQGIYEQKDLRAAAGFILDLAMRTVQSESGSVFISDINGHDLRFVAARGPKADEVMRFRVAMGQGIVGFAAVEGVAVAVSDVHRDPRFYAAISKALGYETKSILCAPAQDEGRVFGAVELINRKNGTSFTNQEVDILNYLAHQFADYLINTGQTGD